MTGGGESAAAGAAAARASSVYVYGVLRRPPSGGPPSGERPVRTVEGAGFAALVSDVPQSWRAAGRKDVETHDRVLAQLLEHETVIPMRFGIVMGSDDDVRRLLLERHADQLEALFERLEGRQQMSVKAYYLEEALLRRVLARQPHLKRRSQELEALPVAASQQERIELGRRVATAVEEQRELDERELLAQLAEVAEDVSVEPPVTERQVLNLHLLVDARGRKQLDALVKRLGAEHSRWVAFRYVGPLAPYSFTDLSLDVEEEATWD
jgi:Gas vesicle synthesis protein GvpL/GvpF